MGDAMPTDTESLELLNRRKGGEEVKTIVMTVGKGGFACALARDLSR